MKILQSVRLLMRYFNDIVRDVEYKNVHSTATIARDVQVTVPDNLIMEEYCGLGPGAKILNLRAKFIMKKYSFSGPDLMAVTGNHMAVVGIPMKFVDDKMKDELDLNHEYDKDIIVDEDVWIGARVTLLSGVHIGRGCIVSAGAVVTRDLPPYTICGGVPAKAIKQRWTVEQILDHEKSLYPENERLSFESIVIESCK